MYPSPRFKIEKLRTGSNKGLWNVYDRKTGRNSQFFIWSTTIRFTSIILKLNP